MIVEMKACILSVEFHPGSLSGKDEWLVRAAPTSSPDGVIEWTQDTAPRPGSWATITISIDETTQGP